MTMRQHHPARLEKRRRGFTLVELLVVVGLMAVVMAVTIAGLQMSSGGAKMRTALFQLKATISLARQHAITRREPIYVVFPEPGSLSANWNNDSVLRNQLSYQAYGVWSPSEGYLSEWTALPPGVIFHWTMTPSESFVVNVFRAGTASDVNRFEIPASTAGRANRPYGASASTAVPCVSFLPNGRLNQTGSSSIEVFVREGTLSPTDPNVAITQQFRRVESVIIRPLTGQMKFKEY
jgi:prepilin-type N-terminal cleavage/methylation domain-containing protein